MIKPEAKKIIDEWCKKTKLKVRYTENGIVIIPKLERKGAYVKELDELDNDLPIVNEAIVKYLTEKKPVEETIRECNDLKQYQKVVKVSHNYLYGWYNGEYLSDKTFRVFASKDKNDSYIGKCKFEGATIEKFANTPDHCFIINEDVNEIQMSIKLDKKWYIDLAKDRLDKKFGMGVSTHSSLI